MSDNKYIWYSEEVLEALNALEYVHYRTKEQSEPTSYIEGRAFYYNDVKKEYGYCDFIPNEYKECTNNRFDIIKKSMLKQEDAKC